MDFDDLEDAEASLGPCPAELRATLAQQRLPEPSRIKFSSLYRMSYPVPADIRGYCAFATDPNIPCIAGSPLLSRPKGKGFGGGTKRLQKVLYLHGPGSNTAMAEKQARAYFV
ncbi:hypothetical protein AK812_SmicGene11412 [Symbiodinium microadriaticum]|uniref:Uncharacterized protein n=1 Tax=Symbiodinium microadriaticum TaxID=2951 RepID=A0A1Q9EDB2_SYMMI|nr:hypothetical protein AK812_SmicGene11412 [Symbiodinium microadriaticum]